NATVYVKKIPVFYTPYFSFPIDDQRKSGILLPTYGNSKLGGFMLQVPYYWNIAPNYDATFTPGWYSKRGIQLGTEVRYLTPGNQGEIALIVLPHDAAFSAFRHTASNYYTKRPYEAARLADKASTYRGYVSWRQMTQFSPRWASTMDYMRVTDDYYFRDFSGQRMPLIPNQLLQQIDLTYTGDHWNFRGLLQDYQTLHPITLGTVNKPYVKFPQLSLSASYPNKKFGLTYQLSNEYTYFTRGLNPGESINPVVGDRIHIQPGISLPLNGISGYITPNLQMFMTGYQLKNQPHNFANQQQRALPVFSLDSGLYFDKETTFGKSVYQQTLEPRLFYLYVPYANQSQIPLFDSALPGFNYDQLFRLNRFNGLDRVGDANQITVALTTRFLDQESGLEKFRASIGQIYYFQNRRVFTCPPSSTLPNAAPNCNPNSPNNPLNVHYPAGGNLSPTAKSSPLAGQLNYKFNPQWETTANVTWDPQTRRTQNGNISLQYRPDKNRLLNLGYNFLQYGDPFQGNPTNLSQTMVSGAWPIKDRWQAVGSWNYNLSHERSQTYFYGIEYNTCCWAARVVVGRTFSGLSPSQEPTYNSAIYFQIQLKGFGNFGAANPTNILNTIPGYRDQFGQI
ncbi:MAG: LPS-assembly protein LptD, partial [Gammaproteobacteria bacterium]